MNPHAEPAGHRRRHRPHPTAGTHRTGRHPAGDTAVALAGGHSSTPAVLGGGLTLLLTLSLPVALLAVAFITEKVHGEGERENLDG
jgi:hypothetical protein